MSLSVAIAEEDLKDRAITPMFKYAEIENVPQSERAGYPVMETRELVEVHIAGKPNCVHVANVTDFCRRDGNRLITYAEEYAEQYRAFKEGNPQEAKGTPLELLREFGVSPALISLCRARSIYSIEALHQLEGPALKSLGIESNKLKEAARNFVAQRTSRVEAMSEVDALRAELAALRAQMAGQSEGTADDDGEEDEDEFSGASVEELKDFIAGKTGARPRGNPSRDTLASMARELAAA